MRKHWKGAGLSLVLSLSVCLSICGCEKKETKQETPREPKAEYSLEQIREEARNFQAEYPNLDLSKTKITIPDGDKIEELIFPVDANIGESKETLDKMRNNVYENVRLLTGKDKVNEKYAIYRFWDNASDSFKELALKDVNEEITKSLIVEPENKENDNDEEEDENVAPIFYMSYNDGDYSTLLWNSLMCEFANKNISKAHKKKSYDFVGYRPPEGMTVKSFDIPGDSIDGISYVLDGKEVPLKNAIEYVEENIGKTGYHYVSSPYLTYEVFHVDVIEYNDDQYYYDMYLKALYKGISFSSDDYSSNSPLEGEVDYEIFSMYHQVAMLVENSMDFIWSSTHQYEEKKEGEVYDRFLSLDDAMHLLSNAVSSSTTLHCDSVELLYRTEFHQYPPYPPYCYEVQCHPVYQVKCVNTGLPDYPVLFFNVDAITGMVEGAKTLLPNS